MDVRAIYLDDVEACIYHFHKIIFFSTAMWGKKIVEIGYQMFAVVCACELKKERIQKIFKVQPKYQ